MDRDSVNLFSTEQIELQFWLGFGFSKESQWNHISVIGNPADHATIGIPLSELDKLWFQPSDFLMTPESEWFKPPHREIIFFSTKLGEVEPLIDFLRFSDWLKLLKVITMILMFISSLRPKGKILPYDYHRNSATSLICKISRIEFLPETVKRLYQGKKWDKKEVLLAFSPFMDDNAMKARGHLRNRKKKHFS